MTTFDPKFVKSAKEDFDLHVRLLMRKNGLSKANASAIAYAHGRAMLQDAMGQPSLPLEEGKK